MDVEDQPVEIGIGAVRIRAAAMWAIAAVATLLVLREAAPVLVPILVSILLAYALEPAVGALVRCRLPRVLAASIVYVVLAIAIGAAVQKLRGPVNAFLDDLPNTIAAMRDAFAAHDDGGPGPIDRLDETAKTLHEATTAATPAPAPGVARVAVVSKRPDVRGYLAGLAHGAIRTGIQFFAIALLTFLLLATGDRYKKMTIALAGRTFVNRKITLELMASIDRQIERYLVVRVLISAIVATATGIALGLLGVNHAAAWGIVAGVLNVFPFIGPTAGVALITVAAFVQFRTLEMTAAAGGAALAVAAIEGNLLTPLLMSRAGELNTVAVFVSVLVWGWVWDAWGLLLAVPIMVAVKAAADHIESLKPLGELLRRESD